MVCHLSASVPHSLFRAGKLIIAQTVISYQLPVIRVRLRATTYAMPVRAVHTQDDRQLTTDDGQLTTALIRPIDHDIDILALDTRLVGRDAEADRLDDRLAGAHVIGPTVP